MKELFTLIISLICTFIIAYPSIVAEEQRKERRKHQDFLDKIRAENRKERQAYLKKLRKMYRVKDDDEEDTPKDSDQPTTDQQQA